MNTSPKRPGIAVALIAIIIAVVIVIAAVGAYYALSLSKTTTTTSSPGSSISTTSTSAVVSATTDSGVSTSQTGVTYYSGTFNFSLPEGPSGVRSLPNGSAQYYNSVQTASGTFTFSTIDNGLSGSGTGKGTFTMTTTGFCSGSETFPYTFTIPDATTELQGNITIFFSNPVPGSYSVALTCTGDMTGVSTATNDPGPFLPVYPNEIGVPIASLPASEIFHGNPSTTFVWGYSLEETSG